MKSWTQVEILAKFRTLLQSLGSVTILANALVDTKYKRAAFKNIAMSVASVDDRCGSEVECKYARP